MSGEFQKDPLALKAQQVAYTGLIYALMGSVVAAPIAVLYLAVRKGKK